MLLLIKWEHDSVYLEYYSGAHMTNRAYKENKQLVTAQTAAFNQSINVSFNLN